MHLFFALLTLCRWAWLSPAAVGEYSCGRSAWCLPRSAAPGRAGSATRQHVGSFHTRIKPTSPALVGRFLTAGPPGRSGIAFYPSSLYVTLLSARPLVRMEMVNPTAACEVSPCHVLTLERKQLSPKEEKTYPTLPSYPVIRGQDSGTRSGNTVPRQALPGACRCLPLGFRAFRLCRLFAVVAFLCGGLPVLLVPARAASLHSTCFPLFKMCMTHSDLWHDPRALCSFQSLRPLAKTVFCNGHTNAHCLLCFTPHQAIKQS